MFNNVQEIHNDMVDMFQLKPLFNGVRSHSRKSGLGLTATSRQSGRDGALNGRRARLRRRQLAEPNSPGATRWFSTKERD